MGRVQGLRQKIAGKSIPVEVRFCFCCLLVGFVWGSVWVMTQVSGARIWARFFTMRFAFRTLYLVAWFPVAPYLSYRIILSPLPNIC
jgi:hypothetical protein